MQKTICLAGLLVLQACAHTTEEWFVVRGASIELSNRHDQLEKAFLSKGPQKLGYDDKEFVVTGHRLKAGNGAVLGYRGFESGILVDSASFTKMTVFLPDSNIVDGLEVRIPNGAGAMAYYSTSSSNFPGAGGCFGYASEGLIKVQSLSESSVTVAIDLQFRLASPLGALGECSDMRRIAGTHVLRRISFQQLTPWQGIAGKTLYDETIAK